jgi:hypothetical protein
MSDKITLHKDGWTDMVIRKSGDKWEYLAYVYTQYGDQRWEVIDMPEEAIFKNIKEYGTIKDEEEHQYLLEMASALMDAEEGTPEGSELDYLSSMIVRYEEEHYPIV